jgi:glycosyltransferase involved in cell wall biosynthesis
MSSNPKISIIIPVYGVENYVAKCIESIKAQTFTNFEAILVNDGTKDNSVVVAEEAISGDERFVIYHKENGGQGSARNLGLDKARGDYIAFIDSDDWVEPDYLKALYEKIISEDADICTCDVLYVDSNGKIVREYKNNPQGYYENNDYLMACWYISNFMCDKLFKRNTFNDVRFDTSLRTNEDVFLLFGLMYQKKIVSIDRFLYNYLQRPAATSKGAPPTLIDDRVKIKNKQIEFSKKINRFDIDVDYIRLVYLKHFVFNTVVVISRYSNVFNQDIKKFKIQLDEKFFNTRNIMELVSSNPKVGLSLLLFKISPTAFRVFARFWFRNKAA